MQKINTLSKDRIEVLTKEAENLQDVFDRNEVEAIKQRRALREDNERLTKQVEFLEEVGKESQEKMVGVMIANPVRSTLRQSLMKRTPILKRGHNASKQNSVLKQSLSTMDSLNNSGPSNQWPEKEGMLTKQGGFHRNWKKRWFVLVGGVLTYYANEKKKEVKGVVELDNCLVTATKDEAIGGKKFCLGVYHKTNRTFFCQAADEDDLKSWIKVLQVTIDKIKSEPADEEQSSTEGSSSNMS